MKFILSVFAMLMVTSYSMYVPQNSQHRFPFRQSRNEPGVFKSIGEYFHRMHVASTKRCVYLLGESCANGGIPGAGSDSDWLNGGFNPGKRTLSRIEENGINGRNPGSNTEATWLNRESSAKRCVNTMDESCSNGGIPGSGADLDWLDGGFNPGKRSLNLFEEGAINGGLSGSGADNDWLSNGFTPGKQSLNIFGKENRGLPGIDLDSNRINKSSKTSSGKRCANIMDESCSNGGIPGSGSDNDWLNGGFTPGKRELGDGEGILGAGNDNDWLHGDNTPGKR